MAQETSLGQPRNIAGAAKKHRWGSQEAKKHNWERQETSRGKDKKHRWVTQETSLGVSLSSDHGRP